MTEQEREGLIAKSFKGVPIAIEHHPDGSVTIAKEVIDEIEEALGRYPQMPDLMEIRSILERIAK
jgi:hypothetical protein